MIAVVTNPKTREQFIYLETGGDGEFTIPAKEVEKCHIYFSEPDGLTVCHMLEKLESL